EKLSAVFKDRIKTKPSKKKERKAAKESPTELKEPTFFDTAVVRLPVWAFNSTVGRALGKKPAAEDLDLVDVDSDNDPVHDTPGTDSAAEDFELLDKSTDSLGKAKSSGAQAGAKVNRRKKSK
ncbi:hypothetical protein BN1708_018317, partial [Verticillium longisporum]